jgi:hypothetical protein
MNIQFKRIESGEWEATGVLNLRGVGETKEKARDDLFSKLSDFNDEYQREHGYRLKFALMFHPADGEQPPDEL